MRKRTTRTATWNQIAQRVDYADLRVDTQERDLRLLCLEAEKLGIPTVVVNPANVALTASFVKGASVKVAAAVSYPVGAYWPDSKGLEVADAIEDGADEVYMLMAVGRFLDGYIDEQTIPEMAALVKDAQGRPTKLITEVSVLTDEQKRTVCQLAVDAGIDYLVASTEFAPSKLPAVTLDDIKVLTKAAGDSMGIIFRGDVKHVEQIDELLQAGVSRFCTSSVRGLKASCENVLA
ncbi:MAG: deoxyribose-phosphate aldolase [Anaerolineae bacterium]